MRYKQLRTVMILLSKNVAKNQGFLHLNIFKIFLWAWLNFKQTCSACNL